MARKTPSERFWQWFIKHQELLFHFDDHGEELAETLQLQLMKVHEDLCYAFGEVVGDKREFVISANGIEAAFPAVIDLYKESPDLPTWTIVPFRPRTSADLQVTLNTITLSSDDVYFSHEHEDDKVGITLFVNAPLSEEVINILFIFLDNALGEYDVATKIGTINFNELEVTQEGMLPFKKIAEVIDSYFTSEEPLVN